MVQLNIFMVQYKMPTLDQKKKGYYFEVDEFSKRLIKEALRIHNNNKAQAARYLNINRTSLVEMCKRWNIK